MKRILLLVLIALAPVMASAHKASDSYLSIGIAEDGRLSGRWDIALRDLDVLLPIDADNDRKLTWSEITKAENDILATAEKGLKLRSTSGSCQLDVGGSPLALDDHVDGRYVVLSLQGRCPDATGLEIGYGLLAGIDAGHRGIARVSLEGVERDMVLVPGQSVRLEIRSPMQSLLSQVKEGIHHIWTGYDHLLFLLSLLLPVALLGASQVQTRLSPRIAWRSTLVLVTAFTVAHSLTLALATFGVVRLPSRLVESAIAASVLIAALHNMLSERPGTRWVMAFGFGLIHGMGFAAVLGELPSAPGPRLIALAGFNAGVEIGQMLVVAAFLPLAISFARRDQLGYRRWGVQAGSLAIALLAFVWMCQRLFDLQLIPG